MSSPTSLALPPGPGASAAARGAGPSRAADRGAPGAFGNALQDALGGTRTADRPAAGRPETTDDVATEAPTGTGDTGPVEDAGSTEGADDAPTPPVTDLPPGLWALLAGVIGPSGTPAGGPPAGVLPPGHIAEGAVGVPAVPSAPVPGLPGAAGPLPDAAPGAPAPAPALAPPGVVPPSAPVDTAALARAAGLTVVVADGPDTGVVPLPPPVAPATDTAPAPHAAPAVAAVTAQGGDPGPGTGSGTGTPTPGAAAVETGPAADDLATTAPGAPAPAPAPAPPPTPAVSAAARETPVAAQLAPQLAVLRNAPDGSQTMTVVLTPESLGQVTVQVTITDGTLDLSLRGGSEHGRHALTDALPDLRRDLEAAGLTFSRLSVDPDAPRDGGPGSRTAEQLLADLRGGGQQQNGQQHGGAPRSRGWATADPPGEAGPASVPHPSASSGVDVRV